VFIVRLRVLLHQVPALLQQLHGTGGQTQPEVGLAECRRKLGLDHRVLGEFGIELR
jgi:hypothetical protein